MSDQSASTGAQTGAVRRVRRTTSEALPFAPYGVVPLAGLCVLLLFGWIIAAPYAVQAAARQAAERAVEQRGADWARLEVSGQQVLVSGEAPSRSEARALIGAIRQAKAATLFGHARPVTRITDQTRVEAVETATPVIEPTEPEPSRRRVLSPDWTFNLTGGVLTLSGAVPDEATRERIAEAAREALDPPRLQTIEDELTVTDVPAPEGYAEMAARGVETVAACERGEAAFRFERFSLRCEVADADALNVEAVASRPPELGELGPIIVMESEAVESCDNGLALLLGDARIQFAPGSAEINTASSVLLDAIASRARACPGELRIEGHTDSTADNEYNVDLSRRRAEAVRAALIDRNVPSGRLVAEGFGEVRPIASNDTVEGRARNRRIEVRVVRPPG